MCVSSTGARPTLSQLNYLQGRDGPIRVVNTIAFKWESVAVALSIEWNTVQTIKLDNCSRSESATLSMLDLWIKGGGSKPVNWKTLIDSLKIRAGFVTLSEELKSISV